MDAFREAFNMLIILDKCMGNYRAAELMYNERYSKPTKVPAFCRFKNRFLQYDCVRPKRCSQTTIVNKEKSGDVIAYVTVNSQASSRLSATESGIRQMFVIIIPHNYRFHFYHIF